MWYDEYVMFWIITLIIVGFVIWRGFLGYAVPDGHYPNLSRAEVAFVEAVGEAMFPGGGAITPSWKDTGMVAYVDKYLGWHAKPNRLLMHLLFFLIEHATIVFVPSLKRLSSLDNEAAMHYLEGWESSRIYFRRLAFNGLRAILCMCYCADPQVEKELGIFRPEDCQKNAVNP